MKRLISMILMFMLSTSAFGAAPNCNAPGFWSTIKPLADGGFEYSAAQSLCVGQLVQDNKTQAAQIADYSKAISLKDLALTNSDARVALWQKSADDEMDRLNKIETDQKRSDWLIFGLGVVTTLGAGWMASKLIKN